MNSKYLLFIFNYKKKGGSQCHLIYFFLIFL